MADTLTTRRKAMEIMTIIELLFLTISVIGGIAGYRIGSSKNSLLGVAMVPVGMACSLAVLYALYRIMLLSASICDMLFPPRPLCRNGICKACDYEYVGCTENGFRYKCKCGVEYVETGNEFKLLLADGSVKPYMKRAWNKKWKLCTNIFHDKSTMA